MSQSIESLEARRLFAAVAETVGGTVKLSRTGTLFVNGTGSRDIIHVDRGDSGSVAIRFGGALNVDFGKAGSLRSGVYDPHLVKRIKVDAGGGNDAINYSRGDGKRASVTLYGGRGNDVITAAGRTVTLLGGSGNDTLISRQYAGYRYEDDAVRAPYLGEGTINDSLGIADKPNNLAPPRDAKGNIISKEDAFSHKFIESRNVLDGGDGGDVFESLGGEDSVIGGSGPDRLVTSNSLLDLFEDQGDLESRRLRNVGPNLYRSRLAAFDLEYVDETTSGPRWYVELEQNISGFA